MGKEQEKKKHKEKREKRPKYIKVKRGLSLFSLLQVLILAVILAGVFIVFYLNRKKPPEIITVSTLEKMINVSELSTFEAVYNGVAQVQSESKPGTVDYYVSYEAKVKAGINFEEVKFNIDEENKVVTVFVPECVIQETDVDIESLDFLFMNKKANKSSVTEQAYKRCIDDLAYDDEGQKQIINLANQNARNIIEALISPFLSQLDEPYTLEIK